MTWSLYGEKLETADMSGTLRVFQPFVLEKSRDIKAFKTWLIYFNSPVFTNLYLRVYSDRDGYPGSLLWTSDKYWTSSEVSTEAYAAKELWFDFDNPISLRKNTTNHLVLYASGYTGDGLTHLAWVRGIPDPNNEIDITINTKNVARVPFYLGVIDELRR